MANLPKTSFHNNPDNKNKFSISIKMEVSQSLYEEVSQYAEIGYWADLEKTHWVGSQLFIQEYDDNTIHILNHEKFCKGLCTLFKAQASEKYHNRYHNVVDLLSNGNYDASFADDIIQFAIFGKIVYC